MSRERVVGLVAGMVLAACGSAPVCPGGELVAVDGESFCVVAEDAGTADAGMVDTCPEFDGIEPRIRTAADGARTVVLSEASLGRTTWSVGGDRLLYRGGWMWWTEANDRCGVSDGRVWWGVNSLRFRGDGGGGAIDVNSTCEPDTFALLGTMAALSETGTLVVCGVGHHPYLDVRCGTIAEPGNFTEVDSVERPQTATLGPRPGGFVVLHQHLETYARGLRLLDEAGTFERAVELPMSAGPETSWVRQVGDDVWIGRSPGRPGEPAWVERVRVARTLTPVGLLPERIDVSGFSSDATLNTLNEAIADDTGVTFLVREETSDASRLHLVRVRADGTFGIQLIVTDVAVPKLVRRGTGFLVFSQRPGADGEETTAELLRLDCAGRRLEPTLTIASGPVLRARAIGVVPDMNRAWAVVSAETESNVFDHAVVGLDLPPL